MIEITEDVVKNYIAYRYIKSINEKLLKENRFFPEDSFLSELKDIFSKRELHIKPQMIFFRARKIRLDQIDNSKKGSDFEGFNAEESFVNKTTVWPTFGRMNPTGITVLYVASDIRTAITELHPYYSELYSVAKIEVKEELRIVNLSSVDYEAFKDEKYYMIKEIQSLLSNGSSEKDYIFPQFVSSYCNYLGYDGIAYRSKYAKEGDIKDFKGINITIFNYNKCQAVSSKIHRVNRVAIQIDNYKY